MIQVGDFVTIGRSRLTWEVVFTGWTGYATLKSGQASIHRVFKMDNLTLFQKGIK